MKEVWAEKYMQPEYQVNSISGWAFCSLLSHADQVGHEKMLSSIDPHSGISHKSPEECF